MGPPLGGQRERSSRKEEKTVGRAFYLRAVSCLGDPGCPKTGDLPLSPTLSPACWEWDAQLPREWVEVDGTHMGTRWGGGAESKNGGCKKKK